MSLMPNYCNGSFSRKSSLPHDPVPYDGGFSLPVLAGACGCGALRPGAAKQYVASAAARG